MSGCAAKIFSDLYGRRIDPPRPCHRDAAEGERHCRGHLRTLGTVASAEGVVRVVSRACAALHPWQGWGEHRSLREVLG